MSDNFWLTKEQFNKISPLLPNKTRGVPRVDDRRVLSGIIFCLQRGYRCSDVQPLQGLATTKLTHISMSFNLHRMCPYCCYRYLVVMSLRPKPRRDPLLFASSITQNAGSIFTGHEGVLC